MNKHDLFLFCFGWYFRWKTRRDYIISMNIRTRDDILNKKFEWERKALNAEKLKNKDDFIKYSYYLSVLDWILKK